jgi:hypothetical protein
MSRRSPASRHIPSDRLARGAGTIPRLAIVKNSDGSRSDSQTVPLIGLSTGCRSVTQTGSRQTLAEQVRVSALRLFSVDTPAWDHVAVLESTALRRAKTRRIIPMSEDAVFCSYQAKVGILCDDVKLIYG